MTICSKCGKPKARGFYFPRTDGGSDFECSECHPESQRYRGRPGPMNDYLPGGKKYSGALFSKGEDSDG